MSTQSWLIYLSLVFVATATPGPAVFFIMTHSSLHGWRKAIFAALGNIAGLLCLGIIAVTGLGTILQTSEIIFKVIKYAGAIYLVYLGLKLFFQREFDLTALNGEGAFTDISVLKLFLQALGVAMSNPKAIVFLTALFPQFIDIDSALIPQFATLIAVLMLFSFGFLMSYALLAHRIRAWLTRPEQVKVFYRTSGSIFVGFGLLLATSSNH